MKTAGSFLFAALFIAGVPLTASAQDPVTFGVDASAQAGGPGSSSARGVTDAAGPASVDKEKQWAERESKLSEVSTLTGGIGLVHTQHAQGGAVGQFRVGFTTEYFSASFLCSSEFPCRDPRSPNEVLRRDSADHIGGRLTLSMQVATWLDTYLATSALANSNVANRPSLLQVLGDSVLGGKAHGAVSKVLHVGGAFELWLVNGTGSVGLDGGGTGAQLRALATADGREADKRLPVRFSTNLTYVLDNSGEVVKATEAARGAPITRIERFGLNIHRVDHVDVHLGTEFFVADEKVRPFLEYSILVPVNRQGYRCRSDILPSSDKCLATDPLVPSSLTIGSRFLPWRKGFSLTAAFDLGVSGTSSFIEEVRPTPPWMLYLGAGWAIDTQDRPPIVVRERVGAPPSGRKIRGFVHEEGRSEGIGGAVVAWDNHPELTSLSAGADGRFLTHELQPGPYVFSIRADGYKPGQCSTSVGDAGGPTPGSAPGPSQPGGDIQVDCALQPLPRVGNIVGKVKDLETGGFVGGAAVKVVDVARREFSGSTDPQGAFRFELVTPGEATVTIDADGYLVSSETIDVKVRQDNPIEISVKKKPKNPLVAVQNKEIVIRQQVQFAFDSAVILPASTGLLTEIADLLLKTRTIRRVEVQGHTDGSGNAAHNQRLSEDRATAVVAWLSAHGVASERLLPKGYGDTRPLAPNVTELNRKRNRRVQFIILEQDAAAVEPAVRTPAPGSGSKDGAKPASSPSPLTLP